MEVVDEEQFAAASADLARNLIETHLRPPPRLTVTEWAEQHRRLAGNESAEPGPYRVSRTPYAREPQDCMSARSPVEEVVLMWAAQTSKTTVLLNCLGAAIGTNPGPIMIVWPTNTVAKRNSRQRIAPLFNESPQLARKVAANRSRDKANTTLLKEFDGGILVIAGANSAADLRSTPVRDLYLDEVDNFPHDVDGEGDPIKLAEARQTTFARRKRLRASTPTTWTPCCSWSAACPTRSRARSCGRSATCASRGRCSPWVAWCPCSCATGCTTASPRTATGCSASRTSA